MKLNFLILKVTGSLSFVLLILGATPAIAGTVVLTGATGNTCSSYTNFSVDADGNLTVNCNRVAGSATNQPTPAVVPSCTLSTSPATISPGASSILTAICTPAATSYIWTGPGMSGFSATSARGTVNPTGTTPYSVTGINSVGTGNTVTKIVTVSIAGSTTVPTAQSSLAEIRRWNAAFEIRNRIPPNFKWEPIYYMSYLKEMQRVKPFSYFLPESW